MPDQSSQSLIDALLGYFRGKGQDMAAMTPADQGRQFGMTALMAPMALRSSPGATKAFDANMARRLEQQYPNEPTIGRRLIVREGGEPRPYDNPAGSQLPSEFSAAVMRQGMAPAANDAAVPPIQNQLAQTHGALEKMIAALQRSKKSPVLDVIPGGKID